MVSSTPILQSFQPYCNSEPDRNSNVASDLQFRFLTWHFKERDEEGFHQGENDATILRKLFLLFRFLLTT